MPDQELNYWTMPITEIIFSTEFVTSVPSSAYHLLASLRPQEVMSYPLYFRSRELADDLFDHKVEEKRRQGVTLEGIPSDSHWGSVPMGCDKFRGCPAVQIGDKACEVMGNS